MLNNMTMTVVKVEPDMVDHTYGAEPVVNRWAVTMQDFYGNRMTVVTGDTSIVAGTTWTVTVEAAVEPE